MGRNSEIPFTLQELNDFYDALTKVLEMHYCRKYDCPMGRTMTKHHKEQLLNLRFKLQKAIS